MDKIVKDLAGEKLRQPRIIDAGDLMEEAVCAHPALGHEEMEVGVEVDPVAKCLDGRDDSGHKFTPGDSFEITGQGAKGQAAEFTQELAVILEENPEHLRDGEDDLTVGDIEEKLLPHPLAPLLKALGMAGGTKSPGAAGEHKQPFFPAVRTADASKPATWVAAIEVALYDFLDDRA